jgi:hypothetical protein
MCATQYNKALDLQSGEYYYVNRKTNKVRLWRGCVAHSFGPASPLLGCMSSQQTTWKLPAILHGVEVSMFPRVLSTQLKPAAAVLMLQKNARRFLQRHTLARMAVDVYLKVVDAGSGRVVHLFNRRTKQLQWPPPAFVKLRMLESASSGVNQRADTDDEDDGDGECRTLALLAPDV